MTLVARDRRLVRLFTAIVLGRWDVVRDVRASAPAGEPDRAWREAVLQTHVFAGFPRLVEAYATLERAGGLGALEPGEACDDGDDAERGRSLFERVYADDARRVRAMLEAHHHDYARMIVGYAYGRVLTRPGLDADRRELLAVCALAALGQERQLSSHVRGALRCGATARDVEEALACVEDLFPGDGRAAKARAIVAKFTR